ncbi:MAG: UDP-N-acetylmuramoyl-tripeptide--D-alanyl-D-alanine ligase [Candidatus Eremiobacteraeota bacterium]|nr:UDP-N-acetylmuramoyl-tripeptide--D-alanyl-D-alanine ligase [Candidatus Eremiobacteraeota bacterium]
MTILFDDAVSATSAKVFDAQRAPREIRAVTDTRLLLPGDTFVALRGERYDGHAFIREAVAKGAAAVFVDDAGAHATGCTTCVVKNTLHAYMALARRAREQFRGRVLAITGSAGKTTTKYFAAQLLATRYGDRVTASPANENNEIGVSKLLLNASNERDDVLVIEMGARHFGDIGVLTAIARPDVSLLTNVGDAHLEIMGSRARLEATKWAVFETGANAVANWSDEVTQRRAHDLKRPPHWFFAGETDAPIPDEARITALVGRKRLIDVRYGATAERSVNVRVPGEHNCANLAAAAAASLEFDTNFDAIAAAIQSVELPKGRYEIIEVAGMRLVYDAYNANAGGTIAALDAFASETGERHIALLSSMAELGDEAPALHRRVGAHVAAVNVDLALFGGDFADELAAGATRAGLSSERISQFVTNADAAAWLRANGRKGDVVLLKGSRKYKLEEIVAELQS